MKIIYKQNEIIVSGYQYLNNKPNSACKVVIFKDNDVIAETLTNKEGFYIFSFKKNEIQPGSYIIKFFGNGKHPEDSSEWEHFFINDLNSPEFDNIPPDNTTAFFY